MGLTLGTVLPELCASPAVACLVLTEEVTGLTRALPLSRPITHSCAGLPDMPACRNRRDVGRNSGGLRDAFALADICNAVLQRDGRCCITMRCRMHGKRPHLPR
jgi:hypothetical protein